MDMDSRNHTVSKDSPRKADNRHSHNHSLRSHHLGIMHCLITHLQARLKTEDQTLRIQIHQNQIHRYYNRCFHNARAYFDNL